MKNLKLVNGVEYWPSNNWCKGTFINRNILYSFTAKIYEEKSEWGIKGGNVSKLWVKNEETNKVVFNYDRGLDVGTDEMIETGMIADLIYVLSNYAETNHFYKKGDRVKIIDNASSWGTVYVEEMSQWLGKTMTIAQVQERCYIMKEDKGRWAWTTSLIEGIVR